MNKGGDEEGEKKTFYCFSSHAKAKFNTSLNRSKQKSTNSPLGLNMRFQSAIVIVAFRHLNGVPCPSIAVRRVNFRHKSGVIASSGAAAKHKYVSLVVVFGMGVSAGCAGFASPKQAYKYGESDGYFDFEFAILVMSSSSASAWGSSTSIPTSSLNVCLYGEKDSSNNCLLWSALSQIQKVNTPLVLLALASWYLYRSRRDRTHAFVLILGWLGIIILFPQNSRRSKSNIPNSHVELLPLLGT
eukprot:scaffold4110_cov77-Skeletonema_dohrnii-CCMP3373.AAC.19